MASTVSTGLRKGMLKQAATIGKRDIFLDETAFGYALFCTDRLSILETREGGRMVACGSSILNASSGSVIGGGGKPPLSG